MINKFREWVLDVVGAYNERPAAQPRSRIVVRAHEPLAISKKKITKLKQESEPLSKVKEALSVKEQYKSRAVPEEYEIDNVLMQLNPELPEPKKYKINQTYTEQEKLLYHFRFINYSEESLDRLRNSLKNSMKKS